MRAMSGKSHFLRRETRALPGKGKERFTMMRLLFSFFAIALLYGARCASAYDIGCLYPENMPDPFDAQLTMVIYMVNGRLSKLETPVVVYSAHGSALCNMNCLAYHDPSVLNVITERRPLFVVPSYGRNAWSIAMCIAECYNFLNLAAVSEDDEDDLKPLFDEWGLEVSSGIDKELTAAFRSDPATLGLLLKSFDYHPQVMGQIVALEIAAHFALDGWNQVGLFEYDEETGKTVLCTADCQPYADTTGYHPRNNPGGSDKSISKYVVSGNDRYWQPLLESDQRGYFSRQQHVTPHIGTKARYIFPYDKKKHTPDPKYNYHKEALKAVEELRLTAASPDRKSKIAFFDNKLLVRGALQYATVGLWNYSFQEHMGYIYGLDMAEYDAVLHSWREKVYHDLVRPTTVIQRWGNDVLYTYNGDRNSTEAGLIKARDFQAYVRVMPHSEYPSGTSCLCTSYSEITDIYNANRFPDIPLRVVIGDEEEWGLNENCNGEFPSNIRPFGCEEPDQYTFSNVWEYADECGQSRLWGGIHFEAAIAAGDELCAGLGAQSYDLLTVLENGSDYGGNKHYKGGPRPACGECKFGCSKQDQKDNQLGE